MHEFVGPANIRVVFQSDPIPGQSEGDTVAARNQTGRVELVDSAAITGITTSNSACDPSWFTATVDNDRQKPLALGSNVNSATSRDPGADRNSQLMLLIYSSVGLLGLVTFIRRSRRPDAGLSRVPVDGT